MTGEVESFTWEQGKYGVEIRDGYRMTALRHGEPWPAKTDALVGDKFALTLLNTLGDALAERDAALRQAQASDPTASGTFTRPEIPGPQIGVQRVEAAALRKAADLAQDRFIEEQAGIGFARVRTDVLRKWADHLAAGGSWETIPR
jgi:hypothetical protein